METLEMLTCLRLLKLVYGTESSLRQYFFFGMLVKMMTCQTKKLLCVLFT